jgi:hypothetical protein
MIETNILNSMNSRTLEILADWKPAILDGKVTAIIFRTRTRTTSEADVYYQT